MNYSIAEKMNLPVAKINSEEDGEALKNILKDSDLIIDALFGIGLRSEVSDPYWTVIDCMNNSRKKILSVDVPSGLDSDTGKIMGIAVKAAATATLGLPKKGLYEREGPMVSGRIYVVDIGLPKPRLDTHSGF